MYIYKSRADKLMALLQIYQFSEEKVFYLFLLDSKAFAPAKQIASQLNIPNFEKRSSFIPAEQFYLQGDKISTQVLDLFENTYTQAIEKGFTALHIMVDMGFLLSFVQYEDILSTEEQLDRFYATHRAKGMCIYFYESLPAELIEPLKEHHNEVHLAESLLYSHIESRPTCRGGGLAETLDESFADLLLMESKNWSTLLHNKREGLKLTFSPFLSMLNQIIWIADRNLTLHYVSPAVQDLLGCSPSSLENRRMSTLLPPEAYEKLDITTQQVSDLATKNQSIENQSIKNQRGKVYRRFYSTIKDSSGTPIEMEHIVYPLVFNKRVVGFMGTSQEGSALEKLVTFSSESLEERWTKVWNEMPMGVVLTDSEGRVQFINAFFSKLMGNSTERNLPSFEKIWLRESEKPGESLPWTEYSSFLAELREGAERHGKQFTLNTTTANGQSIRVYLTRLPIQTIYTTELHLYFIIPQNLYPPEDMVSRLEWLQLQFEQSDNTEQLQEKCRLSNREMQVVNHIMEGLQNKEIASRLHIAEVTVKKHLSHIFYKCSVQSRFELARKATQFYKAGGKAQ